MLSEAARLPERDRQRPLQHLLDTAAIRGKRLVLLVGQKKAVAIAVRNVSRRRRGSKLHEWLAVAARAHFKGARAGAPARRVLVNRAVATRPSPSGLRPLARLFR